MLIELRLRPQDCCIRGKLRSCVQDEAAAPAASASAVAEGAEAGQAPALAHPTRCNAATAAAAPDACTAGSNGEVDCILAEAIAEAAVAGQAPAPTRPTLCDAATTTTAPGTCAALPTGSVALLLVQAGLNTTKVGRLCKDAGFTPAQEQHLVAAVAAANPARVEALAAEELRRAPTAAATSRNLKTLSSQRETPGTSRSARTAQPSFVTPKPPTEATHAGHLQQGGGAAQSSTPQVVGARQSSAPIHMKHDCST